MGDVTRLAIIIALLCAIAAGGVWVGIRWDDAKDAKREAATRKAIHDATTDIRGPDDVRERLRRLAE